MWDCYRVLLHHHHTYLVIAHGIVGRHLNLVEKNLQSAYKASKQFVNFNKHDILSKRPSFLAADWEESAVDSENNVS